MGWNFGDILDAVGPAVPQDAPAFIHGERVINWGEANRQTNNLARAMIARGSQPGDKIAIYMRNRPEYLMAVAAGWKARLTHVNVNYRYTPQEVWYIFDNSDAQTVVYSSEFRDAVTEIRPRLPGVKTWIEVGAQGDIAPFAESFDTLAHEGNGGPLDIVRSGDDQFFIYTGGTTGMPKGVMWTHHDLRENTLAPARLMGPVPETLEELAAAIRAAGPGARALPAPPLMHGTGLLTGMGAMLAGGCIITLEAPSFDPVELLQVIDRHKPQTLVLVGDSFAKPLLNTLNANPGKYDLSSVMVIVSSGVMWSLEVKQGLLEHMPTAILNDAFSSSEALGMGVSVMAKGAEVQTAKFMLGGRCRVFDDNDQPVAPGSGVPGIVAIGPPIPVGYYKDEEKSARTFRVIDGVRYSIPGDWCIVEADGTLTLLGRGSACINTAGEKVFPEEVEEALKTHPSVEDALVVGLPDEKWGQAVTGVVRLTEGASLDEAALRAHVRQALAGYKTPKRIFATTQVMRASNGKADYPVAKQIAEAAMT
ncbi:MAG: acyl-CoA synthetase [Phenylobacterium sp.]|uniref:acyl-CoA synthetase n=1 Tax=Phenylobacterium sp. TaxID=1871053 RepID=UPI001B50275D|nr:acyl-CoA synthetase [Phenylobacterium sp.]MBP7649348.1 acyl-CoA synthetase [Phenylobacterium sp.]MBP7818066.1 acyl-CoA synthetase [Phenylobacterium sp.]MBP9231234.1 acyl-CoA synthetase [Phenylobacterium sp.]